MDEASARLEQQSSVGSESNGEECSRADSVPRTVDKQICLVGKVADDPSVVEAAGTFGVPVVTSATGEEYFTSEDDIDITTVFVLDDFESAFFNALMKAKKLVLGPPALKQLADRKEELPDNTRPLYNLAMLGVVVCFTGFRVREELTRLLPLVHNMGGSIRKEITARVTHLIANVAGGAKYQYAAVFRVPIMSLDWVLSSWEYRNDLNFSATNEAFVSEYRLKPFHGIRVCFVGFPEAEEEHMKEVLVSNGGTITTLDDRTCTHVVMEQSELFSRDAPSATTPPPPTKSPSSTQSLVTPRTNNPQTSAFISPSTSTVTGNNSFCSSATATPFSKIAVSPQFDTLHEKSHDSIFESTIDDLNVTGSSRKRKGSLEDDATSSKRQRDCSYSEKSKKKISELFKTPMNYFANRRRTISAMSKTLNESVMSSSGIFDVDAVESLDKLSDSVLSQSSKKSRRSLFSRAFSSSKSKRDRKRITLNATKLSFGEASECDGAEGLNASCFPAIHANPVLDCELWKPKETGYSGSPVSRTVVVDESTVGEKPDASLRAHVVKAEWFWTSVQKEISLEEKQYLFDDYIEQVASPHQRRDSHQATPSSASRRKRKRLHETIQSLANPQPSPGLHKRRSSVSDAGLLSVSGSFLDCTASPDKGIVVDGAEPTVVDTPRKGLTARQQVVLELVQTESNYVNILYTIMTMFKKHLEEMPEEEALLNNTELKIIFGNLPPIYDTHLKMLDELRWTSLHWSEDKSIGNILLKYSTDLLKAYPPFINFFEEMKEMLAQCDANKPRFHAFLKACQTRPECGRQGLQDLMIRPVQRLGSISLLLGDILKNTPKSNPDHAALDQALAALREVMTHINEDKRKTEGQRVLFDIFNDIDNCPPDIVSSHRSFITKAEVIQLSSTEGLSSKGNALVLFLFSDQLEVCKKRSKAITLKSPNTVGVNGLHHQKTTVKPYKHVKLMPLNSIKRVIDIRETDDCQKVFSLVFRNNEEYKEKLCSFAMAEDADKTGFLKILARQMANNACTADADKFLAYLEPHQLDIDIGDSNNGTLSKAFKFANKTRLKVERAFSFNKTPSKLKRAVSSMMSPFGSSTNLTPASQLAQMKLASYNNINELGNAENSSESPPPTAPMSVQPTRKMKSSSLGASSLKRL